MSVVISRTPGGNWRYFTKANLPLRKSSSLDIGIRGSTPLCFNNGGVGIVAVLGLTRLPDAVLHKKPRAADNAVAQGVYDADAWETPGVTARVRNFVCLLLSFFCGLIGETGADNDTRRVSRCCRVITGRTASSGFPSSWRRLATPLIHC